MTTPVWIRPWDGGRVKLVNGRERFVLEKQIGGLRKAIVLDATSDEDARAELALFMRDPLGYRTRRKHVEAVTASQAGGVHLDRETLDAFERHCWAREAEGDLTTQYIKQILVPYLGAWAKVLGDKTDLRTLELGTLKSHLKKTWSTAEHKRVVALKAFTAWLREEDMLKRHQDPTVDLKTPPIIPAKSTKRKGYSIGTVQNLYRALGDQAARDVVCLRAKTGMHDTEIDRIARGDAELQRISDPNGIEGVVVFQHLKKGKQHAVSLDAQTFAAAERLQARGSGLTRMQLKREIDAAARAMGLKWKEGQPAPIQPGELRHSFATWATTVGEEVWPAQKRGVDLSKVAERMGHMKKATTALFYIGDHVPFMIWLPLKLEHPEDPAVERATG